MRSRAIKCYKTSKVVKRGACVRLVATKRDEVRYMAFMRQYACEGLTRGLGCAYEVIDVLHWEQNGVFFASGDACVPT
ncbi:MAG: hypothetical protein E7069_05660 [Bacteroidales bacterium]|jgi:hypothetical protein|nr:hypothetical protein [Bacteroidales bacterium]